MMITSIRLPPKHSVLILFVLQRLLLVVATVSSTNIADLSKPWELSPLYNQNAAYCAIQSRLAEPTIGYVVVKDGMLVAEGYTGDYDATDLNHVWSITKSWTSLLIGSLAGDGQLEMNWTLGHVFSDDQVWAGVVDAELKKTITIRELLTMTSGLKDRQVSQTLQGTLTGVLNATTYSSELRGTFKYLSTNHILSRIIVEASGKTPLQYAIDSGIFGALGIQNGTDFWWEALGGVEKSASGLYTNPRTNAKLGVLYLQNGLASEGLQLVDQAWVASSVSNQLPKGVQAALSGLIAAAFSIYRGYGYQWWTDYVEREDDHHVHHHHPEQEGAYTALGIYGQFTSIYPKSNMVVAIMTKDDENVSQTNAELSAALLASTVAHNLNGLDEWAKDCNWKNQHGILETVFTGIYFVSVAIHTFLEVVWTNTLGGVK